MQDNPGKLITHEPFFTALDPDVRVKGSSDPLGLQERTDSEVRQQSSLGVAMRAFIRWIYVSLYSYTLKRGRTVIVRPIAIDYAQI